MAVFVIAVCWLVCAVAAGWVARAGGRPVAEGAALGLLLGLAGLAVEAWLVYHAAAKTRRRARHRSRQAIADRAAQPLGRGASPLHRGEAGRMLADLNRDRDR